MFCCTRDDKIAAHSSKGTFLSELSCCTHSWAVLAQIFDLLWDQQLNWVELILPRREWAFAKWTTLGIWSERHHRLLLKNSSRCRFIDSAGRRKSTYAGLRHPSPDLGSTCSSSSTNVFLFPTLLGNIYLPYSGYSKSIHILEHLTSHSEASLPWTSSHAHLSFCTSVYTWYPAAQCCL